MPRIAVLNRLHLDEWLSGDVAAILEGLQGHRGITCFSRDAPPEGWPRQRGYDGNITECFPGKPNGTTEEREAWLITQPCRDAELVLDIHGNNEPDNDFPFYGISPVSGPLVRGAASLLGSTHAFTSGPPHPAGTIQNYVGWDLSPNTFVLRKLRGWLEDLAQGWIPPARRMREYRIVGGIREDDALKHRLKREYPSLARLPDKVIRALNFPTPAYANCWNADAYGHTGYWGEVAVPGVPQGQHQ